MASYEVGYKKPPRHSQFKPGNAAILTAAASEKPKVRLRL